MLLCKGLIFHNSCGLLNVIILFNTWYVMIITIIIVIFRPPTMLLWTMIHHDFMILKHHLRSSVSITKVIIRSFTSFLAISCIFTFHNNIIIDVMIIIIRTYNLQIMIFLVINFFSKHLWWLYLMQVTSSFCLFIELHTLGSFPFLFSLMWLLFLLWSVVMLGYSEWIIFKLNCLYSLAFIHSPDL